MPQSQDQNLQVNASRDVNGRALLSGGRPLPPRVDENGREQFRVNSAGDVILDINSNASIGGQRLQIHSSLSAEDWRRVRGGMTRARGLVSGRRARFAELNLVDSEPDITMVVSEHQSSSEFAEPDVSVLGRRGGTQDNVQTRVEGVTIPVIANEFTLSTRTQGGMRGSNIAEATRAVERKDEHSYFVGHTVSVGGAKTYGVLTHPDRNGVTAPGVWTVIANVMPTIQRLLNALDADRFGDVPCDLEIPSDLYNILATEVYPDSDDTPLVRILRIPQIAQVASISTEHISGQAVLRANSPEVAEYIDEMDTDVIEWAAHNGMTQQFAVIKVGAFELRSDYMRRMGLAVASGLGTAPTG